MKIKIFTILFILLPFDKIAFADQKFPKWVYVGETINDDLVYIDINNINNKSKNLKQYWTKMNKKKPAQLNGKNYSSFRAFMEVKCDENLVSTNSAKFYQNHDNLGEATLDHGKPNDWKIIVPGSIESDMVFKYVCK